MGEKKQMPELQSQIDLLFQNVGKYKKSAEFKELLQFCKKFKMLSPYNAMLIHIQKPGSKYVLTNEKWTKKYNRRPKKNARPMIILVPFGPVEFVYDIGDTDDMGGNLFQSIPQDITDPFMVHGHLDVRLYETILFNLQYYGIAISPFMAGNSYAGNITYNSVPFKLDVQFKKRPKLYMTWDVRYIISLNSNAKREEAFGSLIHELAHFFCRHLPSYNKSWITRNRSKNEEEFEAETVAWLVCERIGLKTRSDTYLSGYLGNNDEVPDISIESIFKAVCEIEKMLLPMSVKDGFLYKFDEEFKKAVNNAIKSV